MVPSRSLSHLFVFGESRFSFKCSLSCRIVELPSSAFVFVESMSVFSLLVVRVLGLVSSYCSLSFSHSLVRF